MKTVILAAGAGRRLEPLTNVRPKPMIPLANRPLLDHVVEAVVEAGLDEVVIVVGHKRDRIQSHFGDGDDWGIDITYAVQEKQLGTGDAVLTAEEHIGDDFLVLNGDRIIDPSLLERVVAERRSDGENLMAVTHVAEPELYGVVDLDGESYVTDIQEKPPEPAISSDLINAGVYAFGPEIFSAIRETSTHGELELTDVLDRHLDEHPIRALPYGGRWLDVSRPWDLITVNGRLLDESTAARAGSARIDNAAVIAERVALGADSRIYPNATVLRGTALGDNVQVGPNVTIQNSLIMSDVTIQAGSVLRDVVVGENVEIGPNTTIPGGRTDAVLQDTVHRDVRFGGIVGDNASLGGDVTVTPGSFVGNGTEVELGARTDGRIEPDSVVRRG
ncbi:MAG: bifunctional sugar-1-phosphate nucleotidylyltransferase/acetyltransferase [Halodesulfurarchaeum sp.]